MGYNLKVIGKFLAKDVDLKKKYTQKSRIIESGSL